MMEEWRPVVGWEGLYEVSSEGRVRSLGRTIICGSRWGVDRNVTFPSKVMKQSIGSRSKSPVGYLGVTLTPPQAPQGSGQRRLTHHLVLEAFVCTRPAGFEGAHNNGDHLDNRLVNLAWKTTRENGADAVAHGVRVRAHGRFIQVYA